VSAVKRGYSGTMAAAPSGTNRHLYGEDNPLGAPGFDEKVRLLQEVDAFARAADPRVRQVTGSIAGSWKVVEILRPDGRRVRDVRPLVRFNVTVVAGEGDRQEVGSFGMGGRHDWARVLDPAAWKQAVDEALRQAVTNLGSVPAPAG